MPRSTVLLMASLVLSLVAPIARADRRPVTTTMSSSGETDFDAYTRDQLETHEARGRKPAGWVGPWPPRSTDADEDIEIPGGGDAAPLPPEPPVIYDVALPPPEIQAELAGTTPILTEGAEHATEEAPAKRMPATSVNLRAKDLERAAYGHERKGIVAPEDVHGRFTWSSDTEREPVPLYTRAGFVTLVELKNGERPSGGAFCGSCARVMPDGQVSEDGAFIVEAMADKVSIRPRDVSSPETGLLATNLHIVTDAGRTLTFDVIEVTGTGLQPTARHEVRSSREEGSAILDYSFPVRVDQASRVIEDHYRDELAAREREVVAEKAAERLDAYTDARVEKKAGGRKLKIEAATTLGDETVIRMRVDASPGEVADPVAMVETHGRSRMLRTRSVLSQPEGSSLVITLSVEPVVLGKDQRIAVSMMDKVAGAELRASVGRS